MQFVSNRRRRFSGQAILITGAAGHLGRAMAEGVARDGGVPILNGRRRDPLEALASDLAAEGLRARVLAVDISDRERLTPALAAEVDSLEDEGIAVTGLVNNAYAGTAADLNRSPVEYFAEAARINLGAAAHLIELVTPVLARNTGAIVNIASMYGHVSPDPGLYPPGVPVNPPHYGATKAAISQLTRYLAVMLAPQGIRVNCISPGAFPNSDVVGQHPEFIARLESRVPLGRIGHPGEVYGAVALLLGPEASYITGADIPIDGGWTAI